MKKNMGGADRIIRLILTAVIAVLYFTGTITGTLAYVLLALGTVFLITSFVSFCPLYTLVGLNTCKVKNWIFDWLIRKAADLGGFFLLGVDDNDNNFGTSINYLYYRS